MYKQFIRPIIFKLNRDPESIHRVILDLLWLMGSNFITRTWLENRFRADDEKLGQTVFGLKFKNPVGLAAGFDKHAQSLWGLAALGFGHIEIGSYTAKAQPGNPRQRVFRLPKDEALINRFGFNNRGADVMARHLSKIKNLPVPLGINLGKTKVTPLERAAEDYLYSFRKLYDFGGYFAVNVSSPNTPGLRELQDKIFLIDILSGLNNYRSRQNVYKPILVKIAPDLSFGEIDEVLEVVKNQKADGIIAANTTISREGLMRDLNETGGLSGKPLKKISTDIIRHIHRQSPALPIIGVGGIFSAQDAYEKIKAGASLVQVYTGLVYEGPGLVKDINRGLVKLLERDGFKNISEAVGQG